jgi:hypothetical protein
MKISRGTRLLCATSVVGIAAIIAAPAQATSAVDQSQTQLDGNVWGVENIQEMAQQFTAGATGQLTQVDLPITVSASPPESLAVQIESVDSSGLPSGTVLASAAVPASSLPAHSAVPPTWTAVPFAAPATVNAGTQYALVVSSDIGPSGLAAANAGIEDASVSGGYVWWTNLANPYPSGVSFHQGFGAFWNTGGWAPFTFSGPVDVSGNDFGFRTYVSSPYSWSGVQQPINGDNSSIFKLGSTVPVKFQLTGASAGITNLAATLTYTKVSSGVEGTYLEATSTAAATSGDLFRYDATSGQYIYNWSTKGLTTGTYRLKISLGDGVAHTVDVSLK